MSNPQHDILIRALPYARRYARALSGSQARGDGLVADSLKDMLSAGQTAGDPRAALYSHVTRRFDRLAGPGTPEVGLSRKQRQLLLLTALEEIPVEQAAP